MSIQKEIQEGAVREVEREMDEPCDWSEKTLAEHIVDRLWKYLDGKGALIMPLRERLVEE